MNWKEKAVEKIKENKTRRPSENKAGAVFEAVADAMAEFCSQDEEFAQAICQSDKTLAECCTEIMTGVGSSISDLEVYKRAVNFYFTGATVKFSMTVELCGNAENSAPKTSVIDITDLL